MKRLIVLLLFLFWPLRIEALVKYRLYQEEKIYSNDYYIEGENDASFPNKSAVYTTETSDWLEEIPGLKMNRIIQSKTEKVNKEQVRYIRLYNIKADIIRFRLSSIEVYLNGIRTGINLSASNFPQEIYDNIPGYNDNDIKRTLFQYQLKFILIDLKELYNYQDVSLKLSFNGIENEHYYFEILVNDSGKKEDVVFTKVVDENLNGSYELCLDLDQDFTEQIYYQDLYRYTDIKYKYYRLQRNYLDGYYVDVIPGYLKDENDYLEIEETTNLSNEIDDNQERNLNPINNNDTFKENISSIFSQNNEEQTAKGQLIKESNELVPLKIAKQKNDTHIKEKFPFKRLLLIIPFIIGTLVIKIVERKNNKVLSNQYKNK